MKNGHFAIGIRIPPCAAKSGTGSSSGPLKMVSTVRLLGVGIRSVPRARFCIVCELGTNWLKVHKNIGHELSFEGERTPVYDGMRLVQDHIAWRHSNVSRDSVMSYYFEWPGFVNVLIYVDYAA
jgi:hypothetical protein